MEKDDTEARVQTLLAAFRQIGMPLVQAIVEQESQGGVRISPALLNGLIDNTLELSRKIVADVAEEDGAFEAIDPNLRWALTGAASQLVGTAFKAWGKPLDEEHMASLVEVASSLENRFKDDEPVAPDAVPNTASMFRTKMMEAMIPVLGAIAQYSFGRSEHLLLAEVSERLVKTADQVTRALAPAGASPEQWRLLCWNILRAAGQIYAESHFAESDRLLYMEEEARASYFAEHAQIIPMTQVWQSFNQRMAMLATLATYLEVPPAAQFEAGGLS